MHGLLRVERDLPAAVQRTRSHNLCRFDPDGEPIVEEDAAMVWMILPYQAGSITAHRRRESFLDPGYSSHFGNLFLVTSIHFPSLSRLTDGPQ
jgi:hypothetical protein